MNVISRKLNDLWSTSGFLLSCLLCLSFASCYAYFYTFTRFLPIDDEGYLMLSVRSYVEGHPLYDAVFSQYGPFYYFYERFLHATLLLPITHNTTDLLCLIHWITAGCLLGIATCKMTRSRLLGLFAFMQVIAHLKGLTNEPGHPQELIVVLLSIAVLLVANPELSRTKAIFLGSIAAMLVFVKVNVGLFFTVPLFLSLLWQTQWVQGHKNIFGFVTCLGSLGPIVLMRAHLDAFWATKYCLQSSVGILTTGLAWQFFHSAEPSKGKLLICGLQAFLGCSLVLAVAVLMDGTSLIGLAHGLLIGPSQLANVFCYPLKSEFGQWSTLVSFGVAMAAIILRRRLNRFLLLASIIKAAYGIICAVTAADCRFQLNFLVSWSWLLLIPPRSEDRKTGSPAFVRGFLALLAVWQGLQAYPVAGTQVAIATLLMSSVGLLCLRDAIGEIATWPRVNCYLEHAPNRTKALTYVLAFVASFTVFALNWCPLNQVRSDYRSTESLGLSGSTWLHLPEEQAGDYKRLAAVLSSECDTFFTYPGMNSFYFWANKPPPNSLNTTVWAALLTEIQQTEILEIIRKKKRVLIVINEPQERFWSELTTGEKGPLLRFVREECEEFARINGFRILRPKADQERIGNLALAGPFRNSNPWPQNPSRPAF